MIYHVNIDVLALVLMKYSYLTTKIIIKYVHLQILDTKLNIDIRVLI